MYENFSYGNKIKDIVKQIEDKIKPIHWEVDQIVEKNQYRVLEAFRNQNVADFHFNPSTGYGYD